MRRCAAHPRRIQPRVRPLLRRLLHGPRPLLRRPLPANRRARFRPSGRLHSDRLLSQVRTHLAQDRRSSKAAICPLRQSKPSRLKSPDPLPYRRQKLPVQNRPPSHPHRRNKPSRMATESPWPTTWLPLKARNQGRKRQPPSRFLQPWADHSPRRSPLHRPRPHRPSLRPQRLRPRDLSRHLLTARSPRQPHQPRLQRSPQTSTLCAPPWFRPWRRPDIRARPLCSRPAHGPSMDRICELKSPAWAKRCSASR